MTWFPNTQQQNRDQKEVERKKQKFLETFRVLMNFVKKHMEVKTQ